VEENQLAGTSCWTQAVILPWKKIRRLAWPCWMGTKPRGLVGYKEVVVERQGAATWYITLVNDVDAAGACG
jgi:hypothetical protein